MLNYLLLSILPLTASSISHAYRRLRLMGALLAVATLAVAFFAAGRQFPLVEISEIQLSFEPLSRLAYTSFLMLAALAIMYGWVAGEGERLFAIGLAITGFLGLAFSVSGDLLSSGLAFGLAALVATFGIGVSRSGKEARRAPMRYACYMVGAEMCLVGAFSLATRFEVTRDPTIERLIFALLSIFLLTVLGAFPFNLWFPKTFERGELMMVALVTSALGIGGAWLFVQTYAIFPWLLVEPGPAEVLMTAATLGTVGASLIALTRRRLDQLIAYSIASNAGVVAVGLATGTAIGVVGGLFGLLNYLWSLLLMLMCLDVSGRAWLEGDPAIRIPRSAPAVLGLCIGGLALAGAPPTAGFIGRWMIYQAAADFSGYLALLLVASSALVFLAHARFLRDAWMHPAASGAQEDAPPLLSTMTILLAILILVVGVYPTPIIQTIGEAIAGMPLF